MTAETVTREEVIALARRMPLEKLAQWYEYGLFVQARPFLVSVDKTASEGEVALDEELLMWERAGDEDWETIERVIEEKV